jgi:L-methionine (R)-S-oxide reductase
MKLAFLRGLEKAPTFLVPIINPPFADNSPHPSRADQPRRFDNPEARPHLDAAARGCYIDRAEAPALARRSKVKNTDPLVGRYRRIHAQLIPLLLETTNRVARMATIASLLHHKMPHFFWTGFYLLHRGELVVGPYQGSLACPVLEKNTGVCWAGVLRRETIIVPDVHKFPGHIACDSRSNSEIVVPLFDVRQRALGVLDVDSREFAAFSETDREWLEKIVGLI